MGRRPEYAPPCSQGPGEKTYVATVYALSASNVSFDVLTPTQIRRYVDSGEPMGKAGGYGIQGRAGLWVSHISGSYSGIMGLPAHETAQVLHAAGLRLI